ncbi:acetoacetate--CoA ligase [Acidihalobacter ferrooxydans]|uniref:Acetoacetate--CoA ligase n=1 Tax=Acidihalobacter ferrooxydans TaxID=1765967 RepID=A0A1P8UHZ4_9GAMM|nr:acetoacetate--CoA ligase [Acidihalobacter ferrooxydans]APZ43456.1 acetoacetate--CoA ligase [Acidihalobacter ferrooxydans]
MEEPVWRPDARRSENSNMARFVRFVRERTGNVDMVRYAPLWKFSVREPEQFWPLVWEFCGVRAVGEPTPVLVNGDAMPGAHWYPNVRLNFAENLLRHRSDAPAIVFRNEWGHAREFSHAQLYAQVARLVAALRQAGVSPGDRVAGYLPNLPETVIAMLATVSLGAIWSSTSPDFGAQSVVDRFGQIQPKVLFAADAYPYGGKTHAYLDRVREVSAALPTLERIVVVAYSGAPVALSDWPRAVAWDAFVGAHDAGRIEFAQMPFAHPLYILYSSGTTGVPKCIVHGAGGTLLQHLKELVLHTDLKHDDRIFYYTTCGWMMWNWLVSGLATGACIVLYDGSPLRQKGSVLWNLIDATGVSIFGASAKWLAAVEKMGVRPRESHRLSSLRTVLSTGSPLAPESYDYVYRDVKRDVLLASISGGTDIVSCFALGNPLLPVYRGELQCRGLGLKVEAYNERGQPVRGAPGELVCEAPFPAMPVGFWNDPDGVKYRAAYFQRFPGVWAHGDFIEITPRGGVIIYGRADATLNPGGVRIGTAEIYRQVEQLDEVLESVAVGQQWKGDVRIVLFVCLRDGLELDDALRERIRQLIRTNTTARHVPARIEQVTDIPRTISGKITEIAVRDMIHGRPVGNIDALANPDALGEFAALRETLEAG